MAILDLKKKSWQWTVMLALAFVWGSSFILMKKGLEVYSYAQVACIRISISFLVLLPIAWKHLAKIERKDWKYLLIVGFCGTGIPAFLFAKAQTHISSSLAGMLNSLVPLFTLLLGLVVFKLRFPKHRILGVIIGLTGALGLLGIGNTGGLNGDGKYGLLVVFATLCYGVSVNVIKKYLNHIKSTAITAISILFIGPPVTLFLFLTDFTSRLDGSYPSLSSLGAVLLLGFFGTAVAIVIFNMLIKQVSPLFASSVTYLIPIVAIFWGVADGETISAIQFTSIGIILTGVYLVNRS
jgi:drug/metabolite transporter (DMT)-like permease